MLTRLLLALLLATTVLGGGCRRQAESTDNTAKLTVTVSIPPLKFLVDQIGGEAATCQVLLGPGRSPATYEPTPAQMTALSQSALLVLAGVPYEQAVRPRLESLYPDMAILDLAPADPDPVHPHDHSELDPHSWLDPVAVLAKADRVRQALTRLDSAHAEPHQRRFDSLATTLTALDRDLASLFKSTTRRRFYCYHPEY